jgi:hypothetical protein
MSITDGWHDAYGNPGDNRHCGFPTKSGRPCRAHAVMLDGGKLLGCYLHDPRRRRRERKLMAFGEWLERARVTDDPEGDLIDDIRRDRNPPPQFPTLEAMQRYLQSRNACQQAIEAAPIVWRRYRRWQNQAR